MFIDPPLMHFPTVFFSIQFQEELGSRGTRDDADVCADASCSFPDGSSFHLPLDSIGSFSISRRMTLSIEYEVKGADGGSGVASVEPLYSFVYNTNWDGRGRGGGTANEEWMMIRPEEHAGAPVGKAQDLPVTIQVKDLMAMAQWPQLMTIQSGSVTGSEVKLFYLLEFDVMVEGGNRAAPPDGLPSEHVILSLELHACAHADWRSPWNSSSSITTEQVPDAPLTGIQAAGLPGSGLQHAEGGEGAAAGDEGQWSHYKCSAGKQWFDDAEVGSASSSGMHAESARHVNRSQPQPLHVQIVQIAQSDTSQARVHVLRPVHDRARYVLVEYYSELQSSSIKLPIVIFTQA